MLRVRPGQLLAILFPTLGFLVAGSLVPAVQPGGAQQRGELPQEIRPGGQQQAGDGDSADEGPVARDLFGRPTPSSEELYEKIQGAWQLVAIQDPELDEEGRSVAGMLLVSGQFLAIELHVAWDDADGQPLDDEFQTGFHEFVLDRTGRMTLLSLIGSYLDDLLLLEWESPGLVREFQVQTDGAFLTLSRLDGSALQFVRRTARVGRSRDIFGRSQETEGVSVSRDIYGRPIRVRPADVEDVQRSGGDGDEGNGEGGDGDERR